MASQDTKGGVVLEFWTIALAPTFSDYMLETIALYEAEHPHVTVRWTDYPLATLGPELLSAASAGRAPDVVNLNVPMLLEYAERGLLLDVSEALSDEAQQVMQRYMTRMLGALRVSDRQLALPWYVAPPVVFYNRDIFLEAGLDPAVPPQSWEALIAYARQIRDRTGRYGFVPDLAGHTLLYRFLEAGLPVLAEDGAEVAYSSPAHVAFLEALLELTSEGYLPEDSVHQNYLTALERYSAGQLGMLITGPQFLLRIKTADPDVYAATLVAPYPLDEGGVIHAPLMGLAIPAGSHHPDEALRFIWHLTSDERMLALSEEAIVFPATEGVVSDPYFTTLPASPRPKDLARLAGARALAYAQDLTPQLPGSPARRQLQQALEAAFLGRMTAREALDAAARPAQARTEPIPYAYLPTAARPEVLPPPQEERARPGGFTLTPRTVLYLSRDTPALRAAAQTLQDELQARFGWTLELEVGGKVPGGGIVIGTIDDLAMQLQLSSRGLEAVTEAEGYLLEVDAAGALVMGGDERGAFYGVQSLRQLLGGGAFLRGTTIRDWPDLPWRVAMVYLDSDSDEVNLRLLPILAAHKFNAVLVMSNYLHWDSAPELHMPGGATKAMAARLVETAKAHLLEPIPLLETLSHVQWLFQNEQNRDLLQDPSVPTPYVYDPLNPRVYRVLFPILDELIELFEPRYLHIGHDEVQGTVPFPASEEGERVGFARLFLSDTLRLYHHLASRGVGTMMWQDTLLESEVIPLLERFPDDIVVTSWHYLPARDYPTLSRVQEAGFRVLGASWFNPANITSLARAAARRNAEGMIQTRWTGYFGNSGMFYGQFPQVYAYLTAASAFWNTAAGPPSDVPERFRRAWQGEPGAAPQAGRLVDLEPYANRTLEGTGEGGWLGRGSNHDLSGMREVAPRFAGVRFTLGPVLSTRGSHLPVADDPEQLEVPLMTRASSLAFLHATGWSAPFGTELGRYVIHYRDGTQDAIPLLYGRNIAAWTDVGVASNELVQAWRGKTRDGQEAAATLLVWHNPRPEVEIDRIDLVSAGAAANPVLLGLTLLD